MLCKSVNLPISVGIDAIFLLESIMEFCIKEEIFRIPKNVHRQNKANIDQHSVKITYINQHFVVLSAAQSLWKVRRVYFRLTNGEESNEIIIVSNTCQTERLSVKKINYFQ